MTRLAGQRVHASALILFALGFASAAAAGSKEDRQAALAVARGHFSRNPAGLGVDLVAKNNVVLDDLGQGHVRFQQLYRGVPVFEGEAIAHVDLASRSVKSVTRALHAIGNLDVEPRLDSDRARARALGKLGLQNGRTEARLAVLVAENGAARLAWCVRVFSDEGPLDHVMFLDARNGDVLRFWNNLHTTEAAGTGQGLIEGSVALTTDFVGGAYFLRDPSRGNELTTDMNNGTTGLGTLFGDADNAWGDGTLSSRQTVAVDAHYGAAVTWDYYQGVHGRNGIADDGVGAFSRVHYSTGYANAFWSDACFCMTYGDGDDGVNYYPFVSLDVTGHEMSHGVTSNTANLTYSGESGGLNEATSDIFGTMVEFYANNPNDPPDYLIGEEIFVDQSGDPPPALRYMWHPSLDGASADCWSRRIRFLDVHYSSGVANHFFYLLAEGTSPGGGLPASPTCDGSTLTGIGRSASERIWYRALTAYMTASTNYAGARQATLAAAQDLFGAGGAQVSAVAAAWTAVNVKAKGKPN